MFALEFVAIVVERRMQNSSKFQKLWESLDSDGLLKQMQAANPCAMTVDGSNFFDSARLEIINPGGETRKSSVARVRCNDLCTIL